MDEGESYERQRGRPRRTIPDKVVQLVTYCYRTGKRRAITVEATPEEIDAFRLDVQTAARRIDRAMQVHIDGFIDGRERPVRVDKKRDIDLWHQIRTLSVRIYLPGTGSIRP